jgi:hypothetical protein
VVDERLSVCQAAREMGYSAVLGKLEPLESSPMNDVLVGWPSTSKGRAPFEDAVDRIVGA